MMRDSTRSLAIAHLLLAMVTVGLAFVPLFDLVGFEFAAAIGCVLAYAGGMRACAAAATGRAATGATAGFPGRELLRCGTENLSLAITPLLLMAANAWRVPTCNWSEGLAFYALLALPAVLYGTGLGFLLGLAWPVRRARWAFVAWSALTYAWVLWNVLGQPPKFAYNAFVGYFPGPIYDAEVPITGTLVLARGVVLLEAVLFVLLAVLAWDGERAHAARVLREWRGERAALAGCVLIVAGSGLAIEWRAAPLGLRIDRRFIQETLGGHVETAHCNIYFDRASTPPQRAAEMAAEHEARYAQLRNFFGVEPRRKIGCYVYASAAQKKRLMGAAGTSFEDALNDEFHINAADDPHPVLTHEMAHIFAAHLRRWAPLSPKIGIHEGIAVAAEWREESGRLGLTPHEACAAMDSLHLLPDLQHGLGAFGFWTQPGARAYTAAGSFVRFLLDSYGMPRFRALWPWGNFRRAYGRPLPVLLAEWRRMLRQVPLSNVAMRRAERLYRRPSIFTQPCAHELARLETEAAAALAGARGAEAESLYARLCAIDGENPEHALDLARARLVARQFQTASQAARQLLDSAAIAAAQRDQAWKIAGDAAWQLDRPAAAESCYAAAIADWAFASERRAGLVALAALHDPALSHSLRDYLTEIGLPESAGLALLAEARIASPAASLPRYLLGRRLYYAGRFEAASAELRAALADPSLLPEARGAALELVGRATLRLGRPAEALAAFDSLLARDLEPAERLRIEDWRERSAWTRDRSQRRAG